MGTGQYTPKSLIQHADNMQMVWTVQAEIFPSRYRATAMALSTASNWTWNFLIAFFTPFITSAIDFRYGYVFAGCNFLAAVIVYFFLNEGQGKTLEEIDTMYIQRVPPWKSAGVVPSAEAAEESTRGDRGKKEEVEGVGAEHVAVP